MFTSYNLIQISNSVKIKLEDGKLKFFGQKGQAKNTLIRNIGDQLQVEEYTYMYLSLEFEYYEVEKYAKFDYVYKINAFRNRIQTFLQDGNI